MALLLPGKCLQIHTVINGAKPQSIASLQAAKP